MKKTIFAMTSMSMLLVLASCGQTSSSSPLSSLTSFSEIVSSSSQVSSSESIVPSSESEISSTESSSSESSSNSSILNEWLPWSEELKNHVNDYLATASEKEANVISNEIYNGTLANGESSYVKYEFKKGKRSNGELACYSASPTQTTYYFYDDEILGGYIEKNGESGKTYTKPTSVNEARFHGYDMSSLMVKSGNNFYGGYASLEKMVENGISNENKDTEFKITESGFEMKYAIYSKKTYTYWDAYMSASFDGEGALVGLNYVYAESYAKNVDKHEDGTFSFKEDAVLDYKETIYTAETGELSLLELPVEPSTFYYASFDLYASGNKIEEGGSANCTIATEGVFLDVNNIAPSTASDSFDPWTISTTNEAGKTSTEGNFFDSETSKLFLNAIRNAGTYQVKVQTRKITKAFTLVVSSAAVESISFTGLKQETGGMSLVAVKSSLAVNESTNICAYINPTGAPQGISMNIVAPDGVSESDYTATQKTYKASDVTLVYYAFSSTKPGVFTFEATSDADPSVKATHQIEVLQPLSVDDVFSGKYCYYDERVSTLYYTFEFEPNIETAKEGDGEVKVTTVRTGKYGVYTYSASNGGKTITLTYKKGIEGTVQDLFDAKITSNGTRASLVLSFKDDPVGWSANVNLMDWSDYENKIAE